MHFFPNHPVLTPPRGNKSSLINNAQGVLRKHQLRTVKAKQIQTIRMFEMINLYQKKKLKWKATPFDLIFSRKADKRLIMTPIMVKTHYFQMRSISMFSCPLDVIFIFHLFPSFHLNQIPLTGGMYLGGTYLPAISPPFHIWQTLVINL